MQGLLRSVAHEVTIAHNRAVSVARLKGQQLFAAPCCSSVVCQSSSECGSVDGALCILLYHTWCSYHRCELLIPGPCTQQYTFFGSRLSIVVGVHVRQLRVIHPFFGAAVYTYFDRGTAHCVCSEHMMTMLPLRPMSGR